MSIKTAVVCGGSSVEHEVSVITAMQAAAALDRNKYTPVALYITKDGRFFTGDNLLDIASYRDIPAALKNAMEVIPVRQGGKSYLMSYPPKTIGKGTFIEIDAVLTAVHGTNVEDGTLQGLLEYWGVPYTGCGVCASACGMDKWVMKALFKAAGIPCVDGVLCNRTDFYSDTDKYLDLVEGRMGYPVVVKPSNLGSSVGISKARDRQSLRDSMINAFTYAQAVICEPAVQHLREINCAVLGDCDGARASVCEEPLNATDILTFGDKYMGGSGSKGAKSGAKAAPAKLGGAKTGGSKGAKSGAKAAPAKLGGAKTGGSKGASGMASLSRKVPADIPADMEAKVKELAVKAFQAIGASGVARVDFLLDDETKELYVNEINTIPGSLSYYLWEAAGMSFTQLVDELISLALKKQRDREKLSFSFETNLLANASIPGSGSKGAKG